MVSLVPHCASRFTRPGVADQALVARGGALQPVRQMPAVAGDVKAADYLRLNYSHPDIACFERFREALPKAIAEAQAGRYAEAVIGFFERAGTERGKAIIDKIRSRQPLLSAAD